MQIDRYTKTLLTIIALCLVHLCARDATQPRIARAANNLPMRVVLTDSTGTPLAGPNFGSGEYVGPVLLVSAHQPASDVKR